MDHVLYMKYQLQLNMFSFSSAILFPNKKSNLTVFILLYKCLSNSLANIMTNTYSFTDDIWNHFEYGIEPTTFDDSNGRLSVKIHIVLFRRCTSMCAIDNKCFAQFLSGNWKHSTFKLIAWERLVPSHVINYLDKKKRND